MIVFHGSDHVAEHPVLNGGKRSNDYGSGGLVPRGARLVNLIAVLLRDGISIHSPRAGRDIKI